jgi:hypothetical protein
MQPSPSRSSTDPWPRAWTPGICLGLVAATAGCPGDDTVCGPPAGAGDGITVTGDGETFRFGELTAAANNDCPAPGSPAGLVSVTVIGQQVAPAGDAVFTLCLPRPDLLEAGSGGVTVPLDPDNHPAEADDRVHVIDVQADLGGGCRWTLDASAPRGTATFEGLCGAAVRSEPWALAVSGEVSVIETCPGQPDREVRVELGGGTIVAPIPP